MNSVQPSTSLTCNKYSRFIFLLSLFTIKLFRKKITMKTIKLHLNYFIRGFHLVNDEIIIYLFIVLFILINLLISFFSAKIKVLSVFTLLLTFLKWSYIVSIPLFINKCIDKKRLDVGYIAKTTLEASKRLIIPGIIIFILLTVVGSFVIGWLVMSNGGNVAKVQTMMSSLYMTGFNSANNPAILLQSLPFIFLISLFTFQPIFFVMKKRGFFISFIDSLIFSVRNWQFIIFVTIFHFLGRLIFPIFYPSTLSGLNSFNLVQRMFFQIPTLITEYVGVIISASSVFYYLRLQKHPTTDI